MVLLFLTTGIILMVWMNSKRHIVYYLFVNRHGVTNLTF